MSPLPSTIVMPRGDACELDGLFVEPDRMRTGVGRRLVEDAKRLRMSAAQCESTWWPILKAVAFYEAVGFTTVGETQTRFGPASRMSLSVAP
jgi:GNAT superfamily N-acetyltransferase